MGTSLIPPVVTRWNSMFDAVSRLLSHKEKLEDLCDKLGFKQNFKFSQTDIQYLEEYKVLMCPIAATLDFLQKENNLMYGYLIPSLVTLSVKLKKISVSNEVSYLKSVAKQLEKILRERFSNYFNLEEKTAVIASVLCPKIKMKWFNALIQISSINYSANDIHKIVITEAIRHLGENGVNINHISELYNQDEFFDFGYAGTCRNFLYKKVFYYNILIINTYLYR